MANVPYTDEEIKSFCISPDDSTKEFINQQTMLRIKDVKRSLNFYTDVLGMRLLKHFHFADMKFSLYFMGYELEKDIPEDSKQKTIWAISRPATIELTHNWGSESDDSVSYHNGNSDPRGFGHIGIHVPNVEKACKRFENQNVKFVKKPNEGMMKNLAFIQDPDGYWIEILNSVNISEL